MKDMNSYHHGLVRLGVPEEIATEDACRIEHVISKESFAAIKNHVKSH